MDPAAASRIAVVGPDPQGLLAAAVTAAGAAPGPVREARGLVWAGGRAAALRELLTGAAVEWVQLPSAGVEDHAPAMQEHPDVVWTSAKGIYGPAVAEHALALLLALRRRVDVHAAARRWTPEAGGAPLVGSRDLVTVLGGGGIAVSLARLLAPFDIRLHVVRRDASGGFPAPHERLYGQGDLAAACTGARAVVVTLPLTDRTRGVVDAAVLRRLAPGAVLVNVGRGAVVDRAALLSLLDSGHLAGAGLDVTDPEPLPEDDPLWRHPRCLITSHTANPDTWRRQQLADLVRRNTARFLAGQELLSRVDPAAAY